MSQIEIPDFASEAEEAAWWFDNQDQLDDDFLKAAEEGRLGQGTAVRLAGLAGDYIYMDPTDIEMARAQADKKGLKYQTYLKMVLHEALLKESKTS
jgi:hypothetical protein